jgi:hypothetical protein
MVLVWAAALPHAAIADWLVLADGSAIETAGAWEVRGGVVIFTRESGGLVSIRKSELNLADSERLTAAGGPQVAEEVPEKAPEVQREATFVITDADVRHVSDGSRESAETSRKSGSDLGGSGASLVVERWGQRDLEAGGVVIFGTLVNSDQDAATGIDLIISVTDNAGAQLAEVSAVLDATTLLPGQRTRFEAPIMDVFTFASVDFRTTSLALKIEQRTESPEPVASDQD